MLCQGFLLDSLRGYSELMGEDEELDFGVATRIGYDEALARRLVAGGDAILVPAGCAPPRGCVTDVLDAALFEPGAWQPDAPKAMPKTVPAETRDHLATPVGLLCQELTHSPVLLLASLQSLLDNALDLDAGRYTGGGSSEVILYALRLALPGIVVVGCGAITATGGGVVRDLLVGRPVRSSGDLRTCARFA